jgi:hypothetical protein
MVNKFKLESWNRKNWKGTKRETPTQVKTLVKRYPKGTEINGKKMGGKFISVIPEKRTVKDKSGKTHELTTIQTKVYGSGVYKVGLDKNGKVITRQKIAGRNVQWWEARKEEVAKHKIYRSSYVLNNVPISKNGYYGFRIVCFAKSEPALRDLKGKMKAKLIKWIEQCVKYSSDDFWFDMYFGYEAPSVTNAFKTEIGKYYLTMENTKGTIIKEESGNCEGL